MNNSSLQKLQTRGRPRKNVEQKLPQIGRKLFSQHHGVFYSTCLIYVNEIFHQTKNQRRVGHSQGGFILYQKLDNRYSFDGVIQDCKQWKLVKILKNKKIIEFIKVINGCGPKIVFREILLLIEDVLLILQQQKINSQLDGQQVQQSEEQYEVILVGFEKFRSTQQLNKRYKYIRFTQSALKQLGLDNVYNHVSEKVDILWLAFVKIMVYTVCCLIKNIDESKYYRLFFLNDFQKSNQQFGLGLWEIVNFQRHIHYCKQRAKQKSKQLKQQKQTNTLYQNNNNKNIKNRTFIQSNKNKIIRFQPILLSNQSANGQYQSRKRVKTQQKQ